MYKYAFYFHARCFFFLVKHARCFNCLCLFNDLTSVGIKSCSVNRKGKSSITWKQVSLFILSLHTNAMSSEEVNLLFFEMMFFFSGTGLVSGEAREGKPTQVQDCAIFPFADCWLIKSRWWWFCQNPWNCYMWWWKTERLVSFFLCVHSFSLTPILLP